MTDPYVHPMQAAIAGARDAITPLGICSTAAAKRRALELAMKDLSAADIGRMAVQWLARHNNHRAAQAMINAATDELGKVMK
jgi:hypothetical protein